MTGLLPWSVRSPVRRRGAGGRRSGGVGRRRRGVRGGGAGLGEELAGLVLGDAQLAGQPAPTRSGGDQRGRPVGVPGRRCRRSRCPARRASGRRPALSPGRCAPPCRFAWSAVTGERSGPWGRPTRTARCTIAPSTAGAIPDRPPPPTTAAAARTRPGRARARSPRPTGRAARARAGGRTAAPPRRSRRRARPATLRRPRRRRPPGAARPGRGSNPQSRARSRSAANDSMAAAPATTVSST